MTLHEINKRIEDVDPLIYRLVTGKFCQWRGAFDYLCSEWSSTSLNSKCSFLKSVNDIVPFREVIDAYYEFLEDKRQSYWLNGLPFALEALMKNGSVLAGVYLLTSEKPLIVLHRNRKQRDSIETLG